MSAPFADELAYREAVRRLTVERAQLGQRKAQLESMGLGPVEIERALEPLEGFQARLAERIARYEVEHALALTDPAALGQRIEREREALGLSAAEFAERAGMSVDEVERHDATCWAALPIGRVAEVLGALGLRAEITLHQSED